MTGQGVDEEVRIARLGAQGDGIAEDGTYVPFALPGERVRVRRFGGRGWPERVVEPAAARAAPPCPHFTRCGGCAMQHADDATVAAWKAAVLADTLAARGIEGGRDPPGADIAPRCPAEGDGGGAARAEGGGDRLSLPRRGRSGGGHVLSGGGAGAGRGAAPARGDRAQGREPQGRDADHADPLARRDRRGRDRGEIAERAGDGAPRRCRGACGAGAARLERRGGGDAGPTDAALRPGAGAAAAGGFLQPTAEGEAALRAAVDEAVGPAARLGDLFAGVGHLRAGAGRAGGGAGARSRRRGGRGTRRRLAPHPGAEGGAGRTPRSLQPPAAGRRDDGPRRAGDRPPARRGAGAGRADRRGRAGAHRLGQLQPRHLRARCAGADRCGLSPRLGAAGRSIPLEPASGTGRRLLAPDRNPG